MGNSGCLGTNPRVTYADNEACDQSSPGRRARSAAANELSILTSGYILFGEAAQAGHAVLRKIDAKPTCLNVPTKPSSPADRLA